MTTHSNDNESTDNQATWDNDGNLTDDFIEWFRSQRPSDLVTNLDDYLDLRPEPVHSDAEIIRTVTADFKARISRLEDKIDLAMPRSTGSPVLDELIEKNEAVASMSDSAEIACLYYGANLTMAEIARGLKIPESAVYERILLAREGTSFLLSHFRDDLWQRQLEENPGYQPFFGPAEIDAQPVKEVSDA